MYADGGYVIFTRYVMQDTEISIPQTPPPQGQLLNLQFEFLEKLKVDGKSRNTLKNYKTDLDCFNHYLTSKQGSLDFADFGPTKVMEYGAFLEAKYSSNNSKRRRIQALRIFFDFLMQKGLFSENPVRKLKASPKVLDVPRPTPQKDIQTLWAYLNDTSKCKNQLEKLIFKRNQVIVLLIYGAGLKVSDLAYLKKDHIHPGTETRVMIVPTKRDPYSVPLPHIFQKVFDEYLEMIKEITEKSGPHFDHILFNANPYRILSGGLSPRGLEIVFEELRRKLDITLTPKSLRQACIFKWLKQKIEDGPIKEWMGVAPSYSLKLYKKHLNEFLYDEGLLETPIVN